MKFSVNYITVLPIHRNHWNDVVLQIFARGNRYRFTWLELFDNLATSGFVVQIYFFACNQSNPLSQYG